MKPRQFANQLPSSKVLLLAVMLAAGAFLSRLVFSAEGGPVYVDQVQRIVVGDAYPAGLAFAPGANAFLVLETGPSDAVIDVRALRPAEEATTIVQLATTIGAGANVAFDRASNRLLLYEKETTTLWGVAVDADGVPDLATLTRYEAGHLGLKGPRGMAVDPGTGELYLLDSEGTGLVRVRLGPDGGPAKDGVNRVPLRESELQGTRGLVFHPGSGHLFTAAVGADKVYEVTRAGRLIAARDLSAFNLQPLQGMVFAPSGDQTDDPEVLSLYLFTSGSRPYSGKGVEQDTESSSAIVELTLAEPVQSEVTAELSLVQTIEAWGWSPPSPDSAGVTYLDHSGTLMVSDSEVNESPDYFGGYNLFETTLSGTLVATFSTIDFSDEPTGVAYNPVNGHLFISDDNGERAVYELNPGGDGQYNTADDTVTSITTSDFGSWDPEGVTYDPAANLLFVVDGVNREVYRVDPGTNGSFDGVAPAGDDQVTHFDTLTLGVDDPEGIAFNGSNGNLFILGSNDIVAEVTPTGGLVRSFSIAAANPIKPAGLAYAPSSQDPEMRSLYVADRGTDESDDPGENDGKIYEFLISGTGNPSTSTPTPAMYLPLAMVDQRSDNPTSTPTPTPTVTPVILRGIEPDSGTVNSSVAVTITGEGFRAGADVSLHNGNGPVPEITEIEVVDGSTITALFSIKDGGPPRARLWDLRVTNPDGGTAVLPNAFTVRP